MNTPTPSRFSRLSSLVTAARSGLGARLPRGRDLQSVADDWKNRLPALPWRQGGDAVADAFTAAGSGGGLLWRSFVAVVLLPTFLYWLYAALWQSERYVTEARLTVREAQKKEQSGVDASSMISKLTGSAGGPSKDTQNSYMVLNYIKSRAILLDLGGRPYLERKFSASGVDYFSRLSRNSTLEDLWKYWLSHVYASVDSLSGILTVRVDAFQAQDAVDIAKDIVRLSETLVNKITVRNRADALALSEIEVNLSREKLAEAREKVLQFRNLNVMIDPGAQAMSVTEMITKLTMERIELVNSLSTFSSSLSSESPATRLRRTRIAAIDQQLAELKKKLTDGQASDTVSAQIATYEKLKLEEQFAEKMYTVAQAAYQTARQDLERQQLYLVTIVTPTLPESATYPRVIANTILVFASLVVAWAVVSLVVASINDQID